MNFYKTSFFTAISTAITLLNGFIVTKVVAVRVGPEGMAYLGQFQNTTSILALVATGAIATGVIKYLAQYKDDLEKKDKIINTAFIIVFCCSLLVSLFVMASSGYLSRAAFKTSDFWIVYFVFGLFSSVVAFNVIALSILNGTKEIKKFTIVNITTSCSIVLFTIILSYSYGLIGLLISSSAASLVVFFLNIFFLKKTGIKWWPDFKKWDKGIFKLLLGFSMMAVVSGLVMPIMQLLIRNKIIDWSSIDDAGYWQAVTKISDYYLVFITTVLSVYYLPKLSEINDRKLLRQEILKGYKIILPLVAVIAFLIWLFRHFVITVLFSPAFSAMEELFAFQLIGDFLKIGSWLLAFLMLAKALTKTYIITEILFSAGLVLLSYFFINRFGIIGATYAFALNYGIYWIIMWLLMRRYIKK